MRLFEFEDKGDTSRTERYRQQQVDQEVTLQRWLQQNPEVLLEETLLVIGRETSSGSGPMDLLALDRFGNTIIFEMKIGDTKSESTSEDKIIGQPQRYAAAIESWDYEKLNEVYQEYQNEIVSEKWSVDDSTMPNDSLMDAFNKVFGTTPNQFNYYQRMVIAAEEVTSSTAQTARYLQRGPGRKSNMQCVQVQQFTSPNDNPHSVLASMMTVDYDLSRVRPPVYTNPVYAEMNARIADRAFQSVKETVNADTPAEVYPDGFGQREPALVSKNPNHPESVTYSLRVKPEEETGHMMITIDIDSDEQATAAIHDHSHRFTDNGYTYTGNSNYRVIYEEWPITDLRDLEQDGLLDEVSERYGSLVQIGHEVLTENY